MALKQSQLYGTELPIGPRLQKLISAGIGEDLLWEEGYPSQEEATKDGKGEFYDTRLWLEIASMEELFDLWCRGINLIGYARSILRAVDGLKKVFMEE